MVSEFAISLNTQLWLLLSARYRRDAGVRAILDEFSQPRSAAAANPQPQQSESSEGPEVSSAFREQPQSGSSSSSQGGQGQQQLTVPGSPQRGAGTAPSSPSKSPQSGISPSGSPPPLDLDEKSGSGSNNLESKSPSKDGKDGKDGSASVDPTKVESTLTDAVFDTRQQEGVITQLFEWASAALAQRAKDKAESKKPAAGTDAVPLPLVMLLQVQRNLLSRVVCPMNVCDRLVLPKLLVFYAGLLATKALQTVQEAKFEADKATEEGVRSIRSSVAGLLLPSFMVCG